MTAGCLLKSGYDDIMEKALLYSTTVSLSRQRLRIKGVVNLSAWNQHGKYMCSIRYFCIGEEEEEVAGWMLASSILGARKASPASSQLHLKPRGS